MTKTIDNKFIGIPQAICGPENITIEGTTEELFEGVVFIKNWRRTNGCATIYTLRENTTTPSFSIPINLIAQCGLVLRRNVGIYGIWVKECSAEAEDGRKMEIIENGCSLDSVIVSNVQYPENNLKAFADGLAFKFPDANEVWISCAVTTCLRKFDQFIITNNTDYLCPKEPDCSKRIKRSVEKEERSIEIYSTDNLVHYKLHVIDQPVHTLPYQSIEEKTMRPFDEICVDKKIFAGTFAALTTAYLAMITVVGSFGLSIYRSQRKQ
uniref:ZP domain-containing protein n=1 Tax=Loa loa TaxID=7209 RepID=A0A1I7V8Q7_LOALO